MAIDLIDITFLQLLALADIEHGAGLESRTHAIYVQCTYVA